MGLVFRLFAVIYLCPSMIIAQPQGKMRMVRYMLNPEKAADTLKVTSTIWYFGSRSIQEVPFIEIRSDSTGDRVKTRVSYLLYIDPAIPQYSYYKSFSDTSKVAIRSKNKKIIWEKGGWDCYSNKRFAYDDNEKLPDTIINGSYYGRQRYGRMINGKTTNIILYSWCMDKDVPIKYLGGFAEQIGCLIVRMDIYFEDRLTAITEVQYVSDHLTDNERIVFDKWSQDANKKVK